MRPGVPGTASGPGRPRAACGARGGRARRPTARGLLALPAARSRHRSGAKAWLDGRSPSRALRTVRPSAAGHRPVGHAEARSCRGGSTRTRPSTLAMDPLGVDPRCIQPLGGGRVLIVNRRLASDDATAFIAVVRRDGTEEWSYRPSDDPQLGKPFCAERIVRDGRDVHAHRRPRRGARLRRRRRQARRVAVRGRRRPRSWCRPPLGPVLGDVHRRRHRAHRRQPRRQSCDRGTLGRLRGRGRAAWLHRGQHRVAVRHARRRGDRGRPADEAALSAAAAR